MFRFLFRSINYYLNNLNLILFFNIFAFFSLFFIFLSNTYVVGGAAFVNNLKSVDLTTYLFAFLLSIISIGFLSVYFCFIASNIKRKECLDSKILDYLYKNLKKYFYKVFTFLILLFLINIILSYLLTYPVKQIVLTFLNLSLLFVPIIIVLEDYDLFSAVYKSIRFLLKKPFEFIILILIISILILLNIYLETIIQVYFGNLFGYIFSILFLSNVVFPILLISLIELFLEIYPISGLGKIY